MEPAEEEVARAPVLTKPGYYTVPPIKRLRRYDDDQLKVTLSCREL